MKAIETRYKGYRFRSRLEARWAVFFDALGIKWEYEPEGYDLGEAGWYLPDFMIYIGDNSAPVWFEVKGKKATKDDIKKLEYLCEATNTHGFIASGTMDCPTVKISRKGLAEVSGAIIHHRAPKSAIDSAINSTANQVEDIRSFEKTLICGFYEDGYGNINIDHLYADDTDKCPDIKNYNAQIFVKGNKGDDVDIVPVITEIAGSGKAAMIRKIHEDWSLSFGFNTGSGRHYRSKKLSSAFNSARSARFEHGETP